MVRAAGGPAPGVWGLFFAFAGGYVSLGLEHLAAAIEPIA
jgi:hypothetical protein